MHSVKEIKYGNNKVKLGFKVPTLCKSSSPCSLDELNSILSFQL